jgi:selenide,water dikinase
VVGYQDAVPEELRTILYDPQTAGGLLIAVHAPNAERLLQQLRTAGVAASAIGEVISGEKPGIEVTE